MKTKTPWIAPLACMKQRLLKASPVTDLAILVAFVSFFAGMLYHASTSPNKESGLALPPVPSAVPTIRPLDSDKLWMIVNDWRASEDLATYQKNELLCDVARSRIYQIKSDWSHDGFMPTIYRIFGTTNLDVGENLASNMPSEKYVLDSWLESESHRETLLRNYRYSCIVTDGSYAVQVFGNL